MIHIKRVYEAVDEKGPGRYLVDRLWPRGVKRDTLNYEAWLKEVAPSDALRRWFGHDPKKWEEFRRRYEGELEARPEVWKPLLEASREGDVTLLYSAKDEAHNNAVVLKAFLERQAERGHG